MLSSTIIIPETLHKELLNVFGQLPDVILQDDERKPWLVITPAMVA